MKVVQIPMIKADLFLRIFESIPGTWKRFETLVETWKHFGNPLLFTNGSNNLSTPALKVLREKNILLVAFFVEFEIIMLST